MLRDVSWMCACVIDSVLLSYVWIGWTHSLELESANDVGGQLLRVGQRDRHDPVALGAS